MPSLSRSLSAFPFRFLFMLPMFTRSTTFCWSSTNHQAFCLRFSSGRAAAPAPAPLRPTLPLAVLSATSRRRPAVPFRYAYTAVFDLCVRVCFPFAVETCSHAAHLNFPHS